MGMMTARGVLTDIFEGAHIGEMNDFLLDRMISRLNYFGFADFSVEFPQEVQTDIGLPTLSAAIPEHMATEAAALAGQEVECVFFTNAYLKPEVWELRPVGGQAIPQPGFDAHGLSDLRFH